MDTKLLSERFKTFAGQECQGSSDLYECLSLKIAEDEELLAMASEAGEDQPVPNLLFGAVHYLLLKGTDHNLKEFYPSIVENPQKAEESFDYFKDFCWLHSEQIKELLKTKLVQTNEVRRCSYLFPVFNYIFAQTKKPLALIEIGTSAGLQLLWDKYSYSYGTSTVFGDKESKVHLCTEIKGDRVPILPDAIPPVASRVGVDLHTNDLNNPEDYLWLKSLIWPEHRERRELFEKAATCVKQNPITLIEGDGVHLLPNLIGNIPNEHAICVFHTHVANQMPLGVKENLLRLIRTIGQRRDVFHIYNNIHDRDLHLDYYLESNEHKKLVGQTEGHGKWFTWEL